MSFPKAKIHRYYDEISCAPPPGKYDPKFDSKVKGAIIEKSKRFSEAKLEERSSSMESISSCCSSQNTPAFRTPKINKKRVVNTPQSSSSHKTKSTPNTCKSRAKLNYSQSSEKDQTYINQLNELTRVHKAQLLEKNEEINQLLYEINGLNDKIKSIESNNQLEEKHIKSEYVNEVNKLRKDLYDAQAILKKEQELYENKLTELKTQNSHLEDTISQNSNVIQNLETSVTCKDALFHDVMDEITEITKEFDNQVERFVKSLKHVDEVNRTLMDEFKITLEKLEKERLLNFEYKFNIETLEDKLTSYQDEINQVLNKCRRYDIAHNDLQKTINELSKRLMESEFEVEHLNEIQKDLVCKKTKLEEEIHVLSQENRQIRDSIDYLQESVILDVQTIQSELLNKMEAYKKFATQESEKQKLCIQEQQKANELLISEIDYYLNKKRELQDEISFCHSKISNQQDEIKNLKLAISEMETDFQDKISAQRALLSQLSNDHEMLNTCFNKEKEAYEKKIAQLYFDKTVLEGECQTKDQAKEELEVEIQFLKSANERKNCLIKEMEEVGFENEKKIEELALKLDHYNDCAQKSNKTIESLLKLNEAKDEQIVKLEGLETEKDLKIESLSDELDNSKAYVQTISEHMVSLKNELAIKNSQFEQFNNEIEMKNATLIQISEEYDKMKIEYENEVENSKKIKNEMAKMKKSHDQYMDDVISELVLEKDRVIELNSIVQRLENEKINSSIYKNEMENLVSDKQVLEEEISEQMEKIQLLEYERIAQELYTDELLEHREDLLGVITRQNNEIDVLSETVDKHFCEIQELNKEKLNKMNEFYLMLDDMQKSENLCAKLNEKLETKTSELNIVILERDQSEAALKYTLEEKNELLAKITVLEEKINDSIQQGLHVTELEGEISKLHCDLMALEYELTEKDKTINKIISESNIESINELRENIEKISEEKEQLKELNNELSMKVTSLEAEISDLECRNKEYLDIIGPFREQLVQFEMERNQLLSKTKNTENELKALELEHAKMLGHQNHKQKIKHIVHLTQTISDLKKENEKYRTENLKLRNEIRAKLSSSVVRKKGKENSLGSEQLNKNKPERTVSPATALKDRN